MRVAPNDIELRFVDSTVEAEAFRAWVPEGQFIGVDTETSGLQPHGPRRDYVRLVQFADENTGWAIPYTHATEVLIQEALYRWAGRLTAHNARFDETFLATEGHTLGAQADDTFLAHHLLYPGQYHSLKSAAGQLYGREVRSGEKWLDAVKAKNRWTWATVPVDHPAYWGYGAFDAVLHTRLATDIIPEVRAQYGPQYDRELQVSRIVSTISAAGLPVDMAYAEQLHAKWLARMAEIRAELEGYSIENPGSRKQIILALEAREWEPVDFTETGQPSVNKAVLQGLDDPVARLVLEYRKWQKYSSAYTRPLIKSSGTLYPIINSMRATTGRMSVEGGVDTAPLQQFPKGPVVRAGILARPGEVMYAVDYDAQEMRLLAAFAADPALTAEVLNGDGDVHGHIATALFGPDYTPEQRQACKNGLYAMAYGAQGPKLALTVHAPAAKFKAAVKAAFPGIMQVMDGVTAKGRQRLDTDGVAWARTAGGRKVAAGRTRIYALTNYLMQGSGSDLLKMAMVKMDDAGLTPYLALPVHDEMLVSVAPDLGAEVAQAVADAMTTMFRGVPFDAEPVGPGASWGEVAH